MCYFRYMLGVLGYRMFSHGGNQGGWQSHISILPDRKVGVYNSLNIRGREGNYNHRLHVFITDLLMGEQTWLDPCPNGEDGDEPEDPEEGIWKSETPEADPKQRHDPSPFNDNIIGTYTEFGYGDVTVYKNSTDDQYYMNYGHVVWVLAPTGTDLTYRGWGMEPNWNYNVGPVEFKECDQQPCASVAMTIWGTLNPTFYRNPGPEPAPNPPCPTS